MRSPRRFLAGVAAALTVCLVATGCDPSPYAAAIDGQVIKQSTFDQQLQTISDNRAFIALTVEASSADGGEGLTVNGQGTGSYSSQWAASVLTAMVDAEVVHQHLVATHNLPGPELTAAARAVSAAQFSTDLQWYRFSPAFRSTIVERSAELAQVVPNAKGVTAKQYATIYKEFETSLFSQVCIRTVDVAVVGNGDSVDYPASLTKATALVHSIDAAGTAGAANSSFGGSVDCYSAAAFEQLSLGLIATVVATKTGQAAAAQKKAYGYEVVAVTSRQLIPNGPVFDRAISAAVQVDTINSAGTIVPSVESLIAKARIKIDPTYGTWVKTKSGYVVKPPAGPAPHAASVAGAV